MARHLVAPCIFKGGNMKFVLDDVVGIKAEDDIGTVKVFKTLDDFLDFY